MSIIRAENVTYEFKVTDENGDTQGVKQALKGLDLQVEPGEFIAILGKNGSGKSTLAKHINALLLPTEGSFWTVEKDTARPENLWDIRQDAGMVFQNPDNQIVAAVVQEDVGFGPENVGVPTDEIWQRVRDSLEKVGMTAYAETAPHRLSGGQKQRVAIAGILAMRPRCLILDESTAMLDPKGRAEVLKSVRELKEKENITILLITHYMEEAALADRILIMNRGRLVMDGTPREVFAKGEELKSWGLELPAAAALTHALRSEGVKLPAGIFSVSELAQALAEIYQQGGMS